MASICTNFGNFCATGQIFIVVNCHRLKNNPAIGSNWTPVIKCLFNEVYGLSVGDKVCQSMPENDHLLRTTKYHCIGRGGCQVVSVLAFYSDDPSSIPAEACSFFCKILCLKRTKIK